MYDVFFAADSAGRVWFKEANKVRGVEAANIARSLFSRIYVHHVSVVKSGEQPKPQPRSFFRNALHNLEAN